MNSSYHRPKHSYKKEIQILSSCQEGLLTTLMIQDGAEESQTDPLFFLDSNLRLMVPNDNDSHLRISYLALLKICFEKKSKATKVILNKFKQQVCREDVSLDLIPLGLIHNKYSKYYHNNIFKKFLLEFLILLENGNRNIIDYINQYPILDTILLVTLKTLLWHRKPDRLIQAQILSVDTLIAYFREVLGIRLVNANDQIIFEDFRMFIGFENWYLFLHDDDSNRLTFAEESRVRPFEECFKTLLGNVSGNNISIPDSTAKTPERNLVQKALQNSWVIPEESIYERLESEDYMFTEKTPQQSRQKQEIKDLIFSFKKNLSRGTESLKQSKQNICYNNCGSFSQRVEYSRKRLQNESVDETSNGFKDMKENYFSNVKDLSIVKMADSFEEVISSQPIGLQKYMIPNMKIINR